MNEEEILFTETKVDLMENISSIISTLTLIRQFEVKELCIEQQIDFLRNKQCIIEVLINNLIKIKQGYTEEKKVHIKLSDKKYMEWEQNIKSIESYFNDTLFNHISKIQDMIKKNE